MAKATRPYRPSNGTDGMHFDEAWCSRCQREAAYREDENSGDTCNILDRSFFFDIGDPEYPPEWVEDDVQFPEPTHPRCTAFLEIGTPGSTYVKDERQNELPI
jgi:hypothetical protein